MKLIIYLLIFFSVHLIAQEQHTYGPVKENGFETWIKPFSGSAYMWVNNDHFVGFYGGSYTHIRCVNFWEWTDYEIPKEATVTSVTITFQAYKGSGDTHNFNISLHNIGYKEDNTSVNFYDAFNLNNQIHSEVISPNQNNIILFEKTFNSTHPVC